MNKQKIMTKEMATKILENHSKWRKGQSSEMIEPALISRAIDIAIKNLKND